MPSSSHIWCEGCHAVRIHANNRYRRCPPCTAEFKAARNRARNGKAMKPIEEPTPLSVEQAVREYRVDALVDQATTTLLEEPARLDKVELLMAEATREIAAGIVEEETKAVPPSTEPTRRSHASNEQVYASFRRVALRIPEDTRLEIGAHYDNPEIPTEAIIKAYGLNNGVLGEIVKDLGITRRTERQGWKPGKRFGPGHFATIDGKKVWSTEVPPKPKRSAVPERSELAPTPEPPDSSQMWRVSVAGDLLIAGTDISDAIARAQRNYPKLRITAINPAG